MIYRCKHFVIQELVSPTVFKQRGEAAWEMLDANLLYTLDVLRDNLGPLTVNNWHTGGQYRESGFRSADSIVGAIWSQHRYGRAADCKFKDVTPAQAFEYIDKNRAVFVYLTTVENVSATPTWLHVDVRNNEDTKLRVVNP